MRPASRLFVPVLVIMLLLTAFRFARAAPVVVISDDYDNRFPYAIDFRLAARADSPITAVQLNFTIGRDGVTSYVYPEFEPGTELTAAYTLVTSGARYIPPMAKVTYWYQMQLRSGEQFQSERRTISFEDVNYEWQRLESGALTVYYHDLSDQRAEVILRAGLATVSAAVTSFAVDVTDPIAIVVYNTLEEMYLALPARRPPGRGGLVVVGQAHPDRDVVLVWDYADEADLVATTRHELQHVITSQATKNPYAAIPDWLNEGLSVFVQGNGEQEFEWFSTRLRERRTAAFLRDLVIRPDGNDEMLALYAQGYLVVKYLHDRYGPQSFRRLLDSYKAGQSTDQAFITAFGKPLDAIDSEWRATFALSPVPARSSGLPSGEPTPVPTLVPLGAPSS